MTAGRGSSVDWERLKALTFDCYGTLIDWETGILAALRPWAERNRISPTDDDLLRAFAREETKCQHERPRELYPDILREVHRRIARSLGVGASEADAEALAASVGDWPPFPDSTEALHRLGGRYKLVIVSNVDHTLFERSRQRLGIDFDAVVTAQDVGAYKPDLRVFEYMLERLQEIGIERSEILHVAQSLYHDHVPAKRMRLGTAWVNRRAGREGWGATLPPDVDVNPDVVVSSLSELADLADVDT